MKVTRFITAYDKALEELSHEFKVDSINIDILKGIFEPIDDDPLLHRPYDIFEEEAKKLKEFVEVDFDFENYLYQLDCYQALLRDNVY